MIDSNPVAVVIVALVGWIAIRLAFDLLRQAGGNVDKVSTSGGREPGDDGAPSHGVAVDHAGDARNYGGDAGDDRGGDGGHRH